MTSNSHILAGLLCAAGILCTGTSRAADYPIQTVPSKQVKVTDGFWAARIETNRTSTIPHLFKMNDEHDRLNNLKKGAGLMPGSYVSRRYNDTDVYKLLEAVGYSLMLHPDPALEKIADEQIEIIGKAQRPDGYIYPARTIDPQHGAPGIGPERWSREGGSHELYNMGHLIEAGVAYSQATGKKDFLDIAVKCADMLCNTFGPDKRHDTSGHEEIELALVKLYRATGQKKYLNLAQFFIDQRGHKHTFGDYGDDEPSFKMYNDRPYRQDDKPVIEQPEAEGHAVRATYLYSGLTDVAALTGEKSYADATTRLWENVVGKKMYVTGGVGSVGGTEAFAANYVLPNNAYAESCAQIGNALWNERLFRLTGDARYLDVMERIVYNGLLSGVSLKGDRFFYQNPLQSFGARARRRGGGGEGDDTGLSGANSGPRQEWFDVACCPANLARFVAQFPGYIYATKGDAIFVDFFASSEADVHMAGLVAERKPFMVHVKQETKYPIDGDIRLTLEPVLPCEFTVNVRVPGWAIDKALPSDLYQFELEQAGKKIGPTISVNGSPATLDIKNGFASVRREWKKGDTIELRLPMRACRVKANDQVAADKGRLALQFGPMVYCVEGIDNGGKVADREVATTGPLTTEFRPDLLGGVTVIKGKWSDGTDFVAVPYCTWGNRGNGEMAVWLKTAAKAE